MKKSFGDTWLGTLLMITGSFAGFIVMICIIPLSLFASYQEGSIGFCGKISIIAYLILGFVAICYKIFNYIYNLGINNNKDSDSKDEE